MNNDGFSILELMITLIITSIVVGLLSTNISGIKKLASAFNEQAIFREQYLIFLLKFEEDYQLAEIQKDMSRSDLDELAFMFDLNKDEDYEDPGERVSYKWNEAKNRVDRKSGNGSYQAFLDGIESFSWKRISIMPVCHQMTIISVFNESGYGIDFCRASMD